MTAVWENEIDTTRHGWGRADVEKLNKVLDEMLARRPELRAKMAEPIDWDAVNREAHDEWKADRARILARRLPERFRNAVCRHQPSRGWLEDYDSGQAPNLVIRGRAGQGKTWEACAVTRGLLERSVPAWFITVPDLLDALRPSTEVQAELAAYQSTPVLVLDDLGAEQTKDWVREQLYRLLNYRHDRMLPTIVTTNLSDQDLVQRYGDRITRRILQGAVQMTVVRRPEIVR